MRKRYEKLHNIKLYFQSKKRAEAGANKRDGIGITEYGKREV